MNKRASFIYVDKDLCVGTTTTLKREDVHFDVQHRSCSRHRVPPEQADGATITIKSQSTLSLMEIALRPCSTCSLC